MRNKFFIPNDDYKAYDGLELVRVDLDHFNLPTKHPIMKWLSLKNIRMVVCLGSRMPNKNYKEYLVSIDAPLPAAIYTFYFEHFTSAIMRSVKGAE